MLPWAAGYNTSEGKGTSNLKGKMGPGPGGKFHKGGPPGDKRPGSLGKRCEGAKGEGDEGGELDPATRSRKALV